MENIEFFPSLGVMENKQVQFGETEVITNLSLNSEYEEVEATKIIYGRMLTGKSINKGGLKNMFESVWQNKAGVNVEDYAEGIVILTFGSEGVKNRILRGQPWHFAGSYLILVEADVMAQVNADSFKQIPFWVQVYGLPPGLLVNPYGEKLGKDIANSMGDFMEFDSMTRRNFMRFRVWLDFSKPLLRGKFLKLDKLKENIWVSFRYERLVKFCYFCGKIDHTQKDCVALVEEMEKGHKPILQYKDSLKTVGLGHVTPSNVNLIQTSNEQQIKKAMEASRTNTKVLSLDPAAKRLKAAISNDNVEVGTNIKKQKDLEEGANNIPPLISKSTTKGMKANSNSPKTTSREAGNK